MKYKGPISDPKDLITKEYVDDNYCGQVSTLPTASADLKGKIYQYIGTTTTTAPIYNHGAFYECKEVSGVYSWEVLSFGEGLPLVGGTMTGPITKQDGGVMIKTDTTESQLTFYGGSSSTDGAVLNLRGDGTSYKGEFELVANSDGKSKSLYGDTAMLCWGDANVALQISTLPTASAEELNNIYQFIGETTTEAPIYTFGHFYVCVSKVVEETTVYSWEEISIGGSGEYLPLTGGTLTGNLNINTTDPDIVLQDTTASNSGTNYITFKNNAGTDIANIHSAYNLLDIQKKATNATDVTAGPLMRFGQSGRIFLQSTDADGTSKGTLTLSTTGGVDYAAEAPIMTIKGNAATSDTALIKFTDTSNVLWSQISNDTADAFVIRKKTTSGAAIANGPSLALNKTGAVQLEATNAAGTTAYQMQISNAGALTFDGASETFSGNLFIEKANPVIYFNGSNDAKATVIAINDASGVRQSQIEWYPTSNMNFRRKATSGSGINKGPRISMTADGEVQAVSTNESGTAQGTFTLSDAGDLSWTGSSETFSGALTVNNDANFITDAPYITYKSTGSSGRTDLVFLDSSGVTYARIKVGSSDQLLLGHQPNDTSAAWSKGAALSLNRDGSAYLRSSVETGGTYYSLNLSNTGALTWNGYNVVTDKYDYPWTVATYSSGPIQSGDVYFCCKNGICCLTAGNLELSYVSGIDTVAIIPDGYQPANTIIGCCYSSQGQVFGGGVYISSSSRSAMITHGLGTSTGDVWFTVSWPVFK